MTMRNLGLAVMAVGFGVAVWGEGAGTQGAGEALDLSTPKKTMVSFLGLMREGKLEDFSKVFATPRTPEEREIALYGISDNVYGLAMSKVLVEKWPDARVPNIQARIEKEQKDVLEKWEEVVTGDTAFVGPAGTATQAKEDAERRGISLVKEKDGWKFALKRSVFFRVSGPRDIERGKELRAAFDKTVAGVKEGKYDNAVEAMKAFDGERRVIFEKYNRGAATGPASEPGR
jgi:hypothetical protein